MKISELGTSISKGIEDLKILRRIYDDSYSISESQVNNSKPHLTKVTIESLPDNNIWEFKSEIQDIECFRSQNETVERTLLHLENNELFTYLIELKSSLADKNIGSLKKKFTCSLVKLTLYLSSNSYFNKFPDIKIVPIGVVCFNDNYFQYTTNPHTIDNYPTLHQEVYKFDFTHTEFIKTSVQIKPVTLNRRQLPILFYQNRDWLSNPPEQTNEFSIDFNEMKEMIIKKHS